MINAPRLILAPPSRTRRTRSTPTLAPLEGELARNTSFLGSPSGIGGAVTRLCVTEGVSPYLQARLRSTPFGAHSRATVSHGLNPVFGHRSRP